MDTLKTDRGEILSIAPEKFLSTETPEINLTQTRVDKWDFNISQEGVLQLILHYLSYLIVDILKVLSKWVFIILSWMRDFLKCTIS